MAITIKGKARETAQAVVKAFEEGKVPAAVATRYLKKHAVPCDKWSRMNQLIVALSGHTDARGFRQWQKAGRKVRKGERAFYILGPSTRTVKKVDEKTGEEVSVKIITGFHSIPVFGYSQTEGAPLAEDKIKREFVEALPLIDVAKKWGLDVTTYNAAEKGYLGYYSPKEKVIGVGVENLSTWTHELVHAADDRLGNNREEPQHWRREAVAELGGAVLLQLLGYEEASDLGGAYEYIRMYSEKHAKKNVLTVCNEVLERVIKCVDHILETAGVERVEQAA